MTQIINDMKLEEHLSTCFDLFSDDVWMPKKSIWRVLKKLSRLFPRYVFLSSLQRDFYDFFLLLSGALGPLVDNLDE